jgi:hypothetical protein
MNISYVVKSPIHGYSGSGYEGRDILEDSFTTEDGARNYLARCNRAFEIQDAAHQSRKYIDGQQLEFIGEMCDGYSFYFTGPSWLVKRTVTEENIS